MAAEQDSSLQELEAAVREIQQRVRSRHPEGERGELGIQLADLMPLVHARDAAEAKVASIGTVNPRPPGLKNNLIQKWKRFVSRLLDWHVREQVEFNRAQMNCVQAILEALNEHNRALERLAGALDDVGASGTVREELADIRRHWQEWRKEWERKLFLNETQFLRSAAELQGSFQHRTAMLEANMRDTIRGQHADFSSALAAGTSEIQKKMWAELERIRGEYQALIHSELRSIRQKAFAAAALQAPAVPQVASAVAPSNEPVGNHPYDFLRFAERFRGSESYVRKGFELYLPYFNNRQPVVDLGCGRGEMLDLLREHGIPAKGVDADAESVGICRSKDLDVEQADIFDWLRNQPEGSLGVIFCAQVIEHLPPLVLPQYIDLCASRLDKGGLLILETPNPECLAIFASHFYLDPTHQRPVPPSLAMFFMEEAGLGAFECRRVAPAVESMPSLAELPPGFRDAFFGGLDYAVIGTKL